MFSYKYIKIKFQDSALYMDLCDWMPHSPAYNQEQLGHFYEIFGISVPPILCSKHSRCSSTHSMGSPQIVDPEGYSRTDIECGTGPSYNGD